MNATIGFLKTGAPITAAIQGPSPVAVTNVTVTGRVTAANGNPIRGAIVTMDDQAGHVRRTLSSSFGYYTFDNVAGGLSYVFSVSAKRYSFTPQTVPVNDNIANLDFVGSSVGRPAP
jgi:hypothetical protein